MIIIFIKDGDVTRVCSRYSQFLPTDDQVGAMQNQYGDDVAADVCIIVAHEHIPDYQEFFDGLFEGGPVTLNCGNEAGKHWAPVSPEPGDTPTRINAQVLQDTLILVERFVPMETVESWSTEMQVQASVWASLLRLKASDNPVIVPPEPEFLRPFRNVCQSPIPRPTSSS